MNEAIPQIAAQEWLDQFMVQTMASPYVDAEARENVLSSWRDLVSGVWKKFTQSISKSSDGKPKQEFIDGIPVYRQTGLSLKEVHRVVYEAFGGRGIKVG